VRVRVSQRHEEGDVVLPVPSLAAVLHGSLGSVQLLLPIHSWPVRWPTLCLCAVHDATPALPERSCKQPVHNRVRAKSCHDSLDTSVHH
jgi:hypothetical protein